MTNVNEINKSIALDILGLLPHDKIQVLKKALLRNDHLTSSYVLETGTMKVYKEGFYLQLSGTRSGFSVFAYDNDGELIPVPRKPVEDKLHLLYVEDFIKFCENDFMNI